VGTWRQHAHHIGRGPGLHRPPSEPGGDRRGELVDLGYGTPEDFETTDVDGKVVQVASNMPSHADRLLHRTEKYYHAVEGGAAGFVFRNHVDGCLPPTGSVGRTDQPIGEIPAVGVSKEVGHRLGRRHGGEQVTISVSADVRPATSQNVHASVGPDTDERVLVTSHVDGHDVSEGRPTTPAARRCSSPSPKPSRVARTTLTRE